MLYRPQSQRTIFAIVGKCLAFVAGALSAFHRTGKDAAYLDTLRDAQLHDLGVRRFDDRGVRYYR